MIKRTHRIAAALLSVVLFTACASSDPAMDSAKRRMPILKAGQEGGRAYTVIKEVKGTSCSKSPNMEESNAYSSMKDQAYDLGADAVVNYECRSASMGKNILCADLGRAIECTGDAVRWKN